MSSSPLTMMDPATTTLVAAAGQVSCDLGSQSAILNLESGIYYGLDSVGSRVWELLQQPRLLADIERCLLAEYEVEPERLTPELGALCRTMADAGLVEIRNGNRA